MRRELLKKKHSLKEALDYAGAQETANKQARQIENVNQHKDNEGTGDINKVIIQKTSTMNKRTCFSCGGTFPHVGGRQKCPAWGKKCLVCEKFNHFAKYCLSSKNRPAGVIKRVRKDDRESSSRSSDVESLYKIDIVGTIAAKDECRPIMSVKIEDYSMDVLIDTRSTVNIINECTYKDIFADRCKLGKTSSILYSYQTNENPTPPLPVIGKFNTYIESKERIIPGTFYVVKGDSRTEPLLSYETAKDLEVVKLVNTTQKETSTNNKLIEEYADLFHGIGKMKGVLVDLHIDPTVEPVAQPHRRIPFSVRPCLEKELIKLEKADIIEKVDKPTGWVSPAVVTPKKNPDEIRLNVDMRVANNAIPRTHNIMPTVEEIIN